MDDFAGALQQCGSTQVVIVGKISFLWQFD